jgi:endoglucanase
LTLVYSEKVGLLVSSIVMKNSWFLRSFFSLTAKLTIIAVLFFAGTYAFEMINAMHTNARRVAVHVEADGPINVWWPTEGAHVSDTQAFKAMVQDKNVNDYDMFWSVDGGQPNQMYSSESDYPHKEAMVDLKDWTWKGSGPYSVSFKAIDHGGNALGEISVNIFTLAPAQGPTTVKSGSVVSAITGISTAEASNSANADQSPSPTPSPTVSTSPSPTAQASRQSNANSNRINTETVTVTPVMSNVNQVAAVVSSTPSPTPVADHVTVKALWPTNGSTFTGTSPFKAIVEGASLSTYTMYWQVDGGQLNGMMDVGSNKEGSVDVTNWNWRGGGPYVVTFIAKNLGGNEIGRQDVTMSVGNGQPSPSPTPNPQPLVSPQPVTQTSQTTPANLANVVNSTFQPSPSPTPSPIPQLVAAAQAGNPLSGQKFYFDPTNDAKRWADERRSSNPGDASQMDKIGNTPTAVWLGNWNSDVGGYVRQKISEANSQGSLPIFIVYNIPLRDCGQYSAGGIDSPDGYRNWIRTIADATGNSKAVYVLEPDALALTTCLSGSQLSDRYGLMQNAVATLKSKSNVSVYIDAGHPNWISADDMANRLNQSGISGADGFALNTSNFYTTQSNIEYGSAISSKVGGKHFIIDTGRNGSGPTPDSQWCNPPGRSLGSKPTASTGNSLVDAFLWLKGPGGSDGNCNGAPSAGVFWPEYALEMAKRS